MSQAADTRMRVVFHGTVQGVGFRYTSVHIASSFDISGFVRNRYDGTVELVAEGQRAELESFLDSLSQRMGRYIRRREIAWEPPTGEFRDFGVRFG